MTTHDARIDDVLSVWFGAADDPPAARQQRWFMPDPAFDAELRGRFGDLVEAAARGELDAWQATARGALALVIVLDQFPRNIFRGTARAFAQDERALGVARAAVAAGRDRELAYLERVFLYLPYEHAEDRATQRESLRLYQALRDGAVAAGAPEDIVKWLDVTLDYARRHAVIIERFGRYPHRNAILGRTSTGEELEFLQEPGSSF